MKKTLEFYPPRVGQIWQDKQRSSTCIFVITKIWKKHYPAKGKKPESWRTRVTGVFTRGEDCLCMDRDLDLGSLGSMFPYLLWNPPLSYDETEDTSMPQ